MDLKLEAAKKFVCLCVHSYYKCQILQYVQICINRQGCLRKLIIKRMPAGTNGQNNVQYISLLKSPPKNDTVSQSEAPVLGTAVVDRTSRPIQSTTAHTSPSPSASQQTTVQCQTTSDVQVTTAPTPAGHGTGQQVPPSPWVSMQNFAPSKYLYSTYFH